MKIEGIGLPMLLFIVFLILKLCKTIDWSWWWVTSPLWIMVLLIIVVMIIYYVAAIIMILRTYRMK